MIPGILTTGNIVVDILTRPVDEIQWGGTRWVDSIAPSLGGNGANTSAAIGKLGIPVRLIGAVGNDAFAEMALARLSECSVDISAIQRLSAGTATTVALVKSDGTRAFLHQPGVGRLLFSEPFRLTPDLARGFSRLHIGNPFAILHLRSFAPALLQQAKSLGLHTSLDTAWDALGEWMRVLGPSLPHTGILFANEDEALMLTGTHEHDKIWRFFRKHGASTLVLKCGPRGCVIFQGDDATHIPAFDVSVVDTTGAGDCFAGAFLSALQRGFALHEAARIANAVGALNVQSLGATTGLLDWEATLEWIKSQ
ncbi:MAG: carbohydrate kinase family protein [Bryobacterales bacterium]|nr:carbohydrate kinase family protein [Bryobacterales bacterium]